LLKHGHPEVASTVKVSSEAILDAGTTVEDVAAAAPERLEQASRLRGEGMILPVASSVHPPDFACGSIRNERVQHGQDWRRTNPGAEEHHAPIARLEDKAPARGARVQAIAEEGARRAVGLHLHADTVLLG